MLQDEGGPIFLDAFDLEPKDKENHTKHEQRMKIHNFGI